MQQPQRDLVHALFGEHQRAFVHAGDVAGGDHGVHVHVAEQRDLLLHVLRKRLFAAAQQNIRLNTDGAQLLDAVLGRLGFQLLRRGDPGHQGHVHEERIFAAQLMAQLADGLEKRKRFDIAHGAADLDDHHVDGGGLSRGSRDAPHRGFDLIGHVRDHLHGFAQIVAAALAGDDLLIDAPAGQVVGLGQRSMGEALIVAQIEIGFGAVVGDEDLAVLERAHGAGIDVEIGIEFLKRHLEPAAFEQTADAGRRDALSQGRNHAARHKYIFSHNY